MQEAEKILRGFPGPVALYPSRGRVLLGVLFWLAILIFCVFYLSGKLGSLGTYDTVMGWFSLFVSTGFLGRGLLLLLVPGTARLTLDAEGFEIGYIFGNRRTYWRDVRAFDIRKRSARGVKIEEVVFTKPGAADVAGALPSNYRLPLQDLLHLMEAWRGRAVPKR